MTPTADCGLRACVAPVLFFYCASANPLHAQQIRREVGVQAYALLGDADRIGGGLYGALRVGPRARLSLFTGLGGGDGNTAGRVETLAHFLLAPGRKQGAGFYLAGGLAADVAERTEARIVALVGVEGRPGARGGWMLEAGVGGGWRVAAGRRWRR